MHSPPADLGMRTKPRIEIDRSSPAATAIQARSARRGRNQFLEIVEGLNQLLHWPRGVDRMLPAFEMLRGQLGKMSAGVMRMRICPPGNCAAQFLCQPVGQGAAAEAILKPAISVMVHLTLLTLVCSANIGILSVAPITGLRSPPSCRLLAPRARH
jgi:hypothetical protein